MIGQRALQLRAEELCRVDAAVASGLFHSLPVAARAKEAVDIDPRYSLQCQHEGLSCQEAIDSQRQRFVAARIRESVKEIFSS